MKTFLKALIFVVVLIVLGSLSAAFYQFHFNIKPGIIKGFIAAAAPPPTTVAAAKAEQKRWEPRISAIGSVRAYQGIDISSQLGGIVAAIRIGSGQDVAQGSELFELDTAVERADLKSNMATLKNADLAFQRQTQLMSGGNTAKANLDAAQATRDQAQAAVDRAKATIALKTLVAPFAGRLGIRKVDIGQYASPGMSLITLQQLDPIYVDFPIPEQSLGSLKPGETVEVKVDAYPDRTFKGKIDLVDARIAAESRSVLVRALFPNPDRRLLPGMFANVDVIAGVPRTVTVAPRTAVNFSLYGDSVFVLTLKEDKPQPGSAQAATAAKVFTATRRFVRTGDTRGDEVAILEGVKPGDTLIAQGQVKLMNGASVVIDPNAKLIAPTTLPKE